MEHPEREKTGLLASRSFRERLKEHATERQTQFQVTWTKKSIM